ncbi:acyltransferase family protein [Lysinibacillus sp. NPDC047702]|uniref:acyltransferase family protein n=1 Tax=unclassified Lysinibacillus TaxID=2636778 RepID=UPI003CFDFA18
MKKLMYLEGLRGVAAIIVVLSHFVQFFYPRLLYSDDSLTHIYLESWISNTPLNLIYNGNFAVCIFFILSGYVLSLKFLKTKDPIVLYEMASKRYFRLAIPVSVSIFISYIIVRVGGIFYSKIMSMTLVSIDKLFELNHNSFQVIKLALYDVFIKGDASYNPVLWTMKYELFGSFMIFILLPLIAYRKYSYIKYVLYIFLVIFISKVAELYFVSFVLGMMLCEMHISKTGFFKFNNKFLKMCYLIIGIYFGTFPYVDTKGSIYEVLQLSILGGNAFVFYHIVGAFFLLMAFIQSELLQRFFSKTIFEFLGKISFSIYLTHFIILFSFSSFLFEKLSHFGFSYNITFILMAVPSLLIMVIIAYFMYKYVDSYAVKISGKVYDRFFKKILISFRSLFTKKTTNDRKTF